MITIINATVTALYVVNKMTCMKRRLLQRLPGVRGLLTKKKVYCDKH